MASNNQRLANDKQTTREFVWRKTYEARKWLVCASLRFCEFVTADSLKLQEGSECVCPPGMPQGLHSVPPQLRKCSLHCRAPCSVQGCSDGVPCGKAFAGGRTGLRAPVSF
jgi:hypothetical protein